MIPIIWMFLVGLVGTIQWIGKDVTRAHRTPSWEIPNYEPYIVGIYGLQSLRIPTKHNIFIYTMGMKQKS